MKEIAKLEEDISRWKETCEILSNDEAIKSIKKSLKQISQGKLLPLLNIKENKK